MARHHARHSARHSTAGLFSVALIMALTGFLLVTNIRVNRSVTVTSDTAGLVAEREELVSKLSSQISNLSEQINTLKDLTSTSSSSTDTEDVGSGTVLPAIEGPGLTVTLDDSPLWEQQVDQSGSSATINDYVVHQQDIEGVVNALWAGGAESMQIQGQRVLPTTAVRCVGNVLLLQGKKYSPPYKVSAIGPTQQMTDALDDSRTIQIYKGYVTSIGLGWSVETSDNLRFAKTTAVLQPLHYATEYKKD
ncbi:DUF881 domain-containing protein [Bifidobacterium psychraerophilum]|jgi:uncharacterized protein YlxW (UPF0749 family)|uniref:DUF881 domain-containing protein n=1 Tax=Bifidobacterium psychraerophilum TaxID=218140 RepID=UPI0023F2EDCB|nr:DUF881 domain-containing protein [Bifidobacterium psychraerophilum]MCI1661007.1 DUF881 domain-containing protein [Bifidobacterium psychraerophilum]MCI1804521.1 DUF881 domain-containing protein [Bifidobacterium psychraerophilum]MCI2176323.1 DUF881 domain-containing protein [Bifidobacterium psychraerophilum]MCI2181203.1 DUF881 domain-containing protein [Bifidobacterium psychraerophilum]